MLSLVLILVILGGVALFVALRSQAGGAMYAINARLGRYGLAGQPTAEVAAPAPSIAGGRRQSGVLRGMNRLAERFHFAAPVARRLERADMKMTPGEFVAITLAVLLGFTLAGLVFKGILGMFIGAVVGGAAPWLYLRRRITKRTRAFVEQLADIAQMMGNSMRAGFSIVQSMDLVSNEAPEPASTEFERVVTEVKLGLPLDNALEHLHQRQPSEDLELMVVAINVQRQIGGNLSEILAVISQTIRERVRFQREVRTMTAQARYSSYIITALPVGVAFVINLMDRPYEQMLYTTTLGYIMLGLAVAMMSLGYFFLRRIANIEV